MSWAAKRRLVVLIILGAVAFAFLAVLAIATFYEAPSCADRTQNQDEAGIDCGGSCPYLCGGETLPPTVLFTTIVTTGEGRTDVLASVENKNANAAAQNVPYRLAVYDAQQTLIQETTGTIDLPPASKVPVYVPGIASGKQIATQAFLSVDASAPRWYRLSADALAVPSVRNITQGGTAEAPRIFALLGNPGVRPLLSARIVVIVHDAAGNVMAASETLLPSIPAQGEATATFTWNSAFPEAPTAIEVLPIVRLP